VNCEEIIDKSETIKKQGEHVLETLSLVTKLSKWGEITIIGSFALDVMWDRDIDIIVGCENGFESSKGFLFECIEQRLVQKVEFGDFEKFPRVNRPKTHIVNLKTEFQEEKWEIEVWFLPLALYYQQKQANETLRENLKNHKVEILIQKELRTLEGKTKYQKSSMEIYEEVMR